MVVVVVVAGETVPGTAVEVASPLAGSPGSTAGGVF